MALGEDVHPRALYGTGGGQGHRKLPPSCAPGFTQPGFLPTHSQWDLMGDRLPGTGAQRLAPEFQIPGPVRGQPTLPAVTCEPGGRGWGWSRGCHFMRGWGDLGRGFGAETEVEEGSGLGVGLGGSNQHGEGAPEGKSPREPCPCTMPPTQTPTGSAPGQERDASWGICCLKRPCSNAVTNTPIWTHIW